MTCPCVFFYLFILFTCRSQRSLLKVIYSYNNDIDLKFYTDTDGTFHKEKLWENGKNLRRTIVRVLNRFGFVILLYNSKNNNPEGLMALLYLPFIGFHNIYC